VILVARLVLSTTNLDVVPGRFLVATTAAH
jgi:hypothetical protein